MPTLSLNGPFKKLIPKEAYQITAHNLAEVYQWIRLNLPILNPLLFEPNVAELKAFVCLLHNDKQIDSSDLLRLVHANDTLELILPMSGG